MTTTKLSLPDPQLGPSFSGNAEFDFPKLLHLFDGKTIQVSNNFKLEPLGPITKVADIFDKVGVSMNIGEKMAGNGESRAVSGPADGGLLDKGGIWFEDLRIHIAND